MTLCFGVPLWWAIKHAKCILPKPKQTLHFYFRWPMPRGLHPNQHVSHIRLSLRTRLPSVAQRLSRALIVSGRSLLAGPTVRGMRYGEMRQQVESKRPA